MTFGIKNFHDEDLKHPDFWYLYFRCLPTKNSLLGWVQTGVQDKQSDSNKWSCDHCTLLNMASSKTCAACLNPRLVEPVKVSGTFCSPSQSGVPGKRKIPETASASPKLVKKVKTSQSNADLENSYSQLRTTASQNAPVLHNSLPVHRFSQKPSNTRTEKVRQQHASKDQAHNKSLDKNKTSTDTAEVKSKIPCCQTHGRRCSMKEVRKEGPNKGRWFFSCTNRACKYFEVRKLG